jgi:predicted Zn-dependent peptidase
LSGDAHVDVLGRTEADDSADSADSADSGDSGDEPERIGRYRITGKLGEGGMGVVYAARDDDLQRDVAVKILRFGDDSGERLLREARALARLAHPNVVTIHEIGRYADGVYVAMELVRGRTFDAWMKEHTGWRERAAMLVQAARGLLAAHRAGLVHRDFKPGNVIVGDDDRVRVLDFGLAVSGAGAAAAAAGELDDSAELDRFTATGAVLGTPLYMAPEQWERGETDERTDQFALCAVAYEAMFGKRPYVAANMRELREAVLDQRLEPVAGSEVPDGLRQAICRGLERDPDARHPTLEPLIKQLEAGAPVKAAPVAPAGRWRWAAAIAIAAAGLAILTAALRVDRGELESIARIDLREAIIATSRASPELLEPIPSDPMEVSVHRLSNGLTVYVSPRRDKPQITAWTVFRAGARDDPPGRRGLAHFVARLMSRGTRRLGTTDYVAERRHLDRIRLLSDQLVATPVDARGRLWARIDEATQQAARFEISDEHQRTLVEIGAESSEITSETGHDTTTFTATFPSNRLSTWLALEADRWQSPVFRGFYSEMGALLERLQIEEQQRRLEDATRAAAFPGHPYAHFAAGDAEDISRISVGDVEDFFERWYAPNNAALILVGDVDRERIVAELEAALSGWEPRAVPSRDPGEAPAPSRPGGVEIKHAEAPTAAVVWRVPRLGDGDWPALTALVHVLNSQVNGVLRRQLDEVADVAASGAALTSYSDGATLAIRARALPGKTPEQVAAAITQAIDSLRRDELDAELVGALGARESHRIARRGARTDVRLRWTRRAFTRGLAWSDVAASYRKTAEITSERLAEVAARHLGTPQTILARSGEVEPVEIPRPRISDVTYAEAPHSAWVEELLAEPIVELEPKFLLGGRHFRRIDTAVGPLVGVANRDDSTFTLAIYWRVGRAEVPLLCAAIDAFEHLDPRSPAARRRELERLRLDLEIEIRCDARSVVIELTGDDARLAESLAAVDAMFAGADVGGASLMSRLESHARREIARATTMDGIVAGSVRLAAFGRFTPRLRLLSPRRIARVSEAEVRAALARLLETRRLLVYYGPREIESLRPLVAARAATRPPSRPAEVFSRPRSVRIVVVDAPRMTASFAMLAVPLARPGEDRRPAFELLGEHLGGEGNPVAIRLRAANLEASALSGLEIPIDAGDDAYAFAKLRGSPELSARAVGQALEVLRSLEIDDARLEAARNLLEKRYQSDWIAPAEIPDRVLAWQRGGLEGDPRIARYSALPGITATDLEPIARAIREAPVIITVVGDARRIDLAALRAIGRVDVYQTGQVYRVE